LKGRPRPPGRGQGKTACRLIPMGDWRDSIAATQTKNRARWRRQNGS
jgi:hypothetical protein